MRRDWTTVGAEHTTQERRERLEAAIGELGWREMPVRDVPALPGLAIKLAIRELALPKVSRVAWGPVIEAPDPADVSQVATYELLGIEANYRNGRVQAYLLDTGSAVVPLCMDFEERAVAA